MIISVRYLASLIMVLDIGVAISSGAQQQLFHDALDFLG